MIDQPRLGFGCASLGSRIAARDGLAALAAAYDAGVRWYDVAPSYGDGRAETLLGEFLKGRRDVTICTKVGILPPTPSLPKRLLRPAVRLALAAAPGLRGAVKKRRPAAVKPPLTATMIAQSVDASLVRLGVERIDVLALHAAQPDEVGRDDILRAIETILTSGKAGKISIASSAEAVRTGLASSTCYTVAQVANNPFEPTLSELAETLQTYPATETVTHSAIGASGMAEALALQIEGNATLRAALDTTGYTGSAREMAVAYLLDYAFATNAKGVVLLSMFSRGHRAYNIARHAAARDDAAIIGIGNLIGGSA